MDWVSLFIIIEHKYYLFTGVEIMYEMYNPTILKIETLKLEKRLDEDLTYLADALPEYSTFNFNMEPVPHAPGKPVPINPLKACFCIFVKQKNLTGDCSFYKRLDYN